MLVASPVSSAARTLPRPRPHHGPGGPDFHTYEGGPAFVREPREELFLLAVGNFVSQRTFYESGGERDDRYARLVGELAVQDPVWTAGLLRWLRGEGKMRTASLVGAAAYVRARLEVGASEGPSNRSVIDSVLQRADEPGELLAHWISVYGRNVPQPVKRGIADGVRRLYTSRSLLKYDTGSKGFRFGDVLNLVHASPDPDRPWQGALFRYILDRRHHPEQAVPPDSDHLLAAHRALMESAVDQRRAVVTGPGGTERLAAAGMTWEALAGWLHGPMDSAVWEAVIPMMAPMALLRNLRNFDGAGVSDEVAAGIAARLSDASEVARSRQFPFRYLAAYQHAPSQRWAAALERALSHSLANIPPLPGRTLILVDRSDSMFWDTVSERSKLTRADAAAVFGTGLAMRAEHADLVEFGWSSAEVPFEPGEPVLEVLKRFHSHGGTHTSKAVRTHYREHDRVVIVTDEQTAPYSPGGPAEPVPADIPVYTWNLAGYRPGHGPTGPHRHTFGGLTDAAFRMVGLIEAGREASWPWTAEPA
ncbi:TROVE domain-containing protein [Streptomyces sp. JV185]|uniref:TROVE domain-containing protein n=1 Tax=Streptomyces sp. JV185 TaxID=858638 RepID=UPI002E768D49|nr:TROVE domain-containing protein [Streptomyces sp. JV185]MEE1768357.1 TROVE domain-containing protein [Streptomyces sp. JV185]MEE1768394.1 TROVE domain-containing protein [Streptomyces sp. JV185]